MPGPKKNVAMLAAVEEALVRGLGFGRIASQICAEFRVTDRTVCRYISAVRERWMREEEELRPERRAHFRAMLMANFRLSLNSENPTAGAATLRVLAKFDGLEAPARVVVAGSFDVRAMSPMERQAEIDRLIALRAQAMREAREQDPD